MGITGKLNIKEYATKESRLPISGLTVKYIYGSSFRKTGGHLKSISFPSLPLDWAFLFFCHQSLCGLVFFAQEWIDHVGRKLPFWLGYVIKCLHPIRRYPSGYFSLIVGILARKRFKSNQLRRASLWQLSPSSLEYSVRFSVCPCDIRLVGSSAYGN